MAGKVIATLPAGPVEKPLEQRSIGEILTDTARLGLLRLRELVSRSMDETSSDRPSWEQRLIFDASTAVVKLLASVEMEAMRRKADEAATSAFIATVDAFERQLYEKTTDRRPVTRVEG